MKAKIHFALCLLAGLMFINAGLDKFFHYMPMAKEIPEKMLKMGMAFAQINWLMPLVGAIEIIGGLLLIFRRTRALGAIVILPVLTGILLTHIIVAPSGLPVAIALSAIITWIIFENKEKYLPMIGEAKTI